MEFLFIKVEALKAWTFLNTGAFLWILQNFLEKFFEAQL